MRWDEIKNRNIANALRAAAAAEFEIWRSVPRLAELIAELECAPDISFADKMLTLAASAFECGYVSGVLAAQDEPK